MGDRFEQLTDKHVEFISQQPMFFVGTATATGFVNISPKGMDTFRVINNRQVAWLNLTGSGNETAAHMLENKRMTIMFCSFAKHPMILRLYGDASVTHSRDRDWDHLISLFPESPGARQVFKLDLTLVQKSCGYAVPYFEPRGQRPTLARWAENRGEEGIREYWEERNTRSLDGKPTGISLTGAVEKKG